MKHFGLGSRDLEAFIRVEYELMAKQILSCRSDRLNDMDKETGADCGENAVDLKLMLKVGWLVGEVGCFSKMKTFRSNDVRDAKFAYVIIILFKRKDFPSTLSFAIPTSACFCKRDRQHGFWASARANRFGSKSRL